MAFYFLFRTALAGLLLSLCAVAKLRPPTVLKTSGVIQVVEDFEMHESRHVITFFVYFDQPIYYKRPGCQGRPQPIGSRQYGYQDRIGPLHGYLKCSGDEKSEEGHLSYVTLPPVGFVRIDKWSKVIVDERLESMEGNMLVFVAKLPNKAALKFPADLGTCELDLRGCAVSTDLPGGSIANFAGDEFVGNIFISPSSMTFGPRHTLLKSARLSSSDEGAILAQESATERGPMILPENMVWSVTELSVERAQLDYEAQENWVHDQVVCRVGRTLTRSADCGIKGGVHWDPVFAVADTATEAGEDLRYAAIATKISTDEETHRSLLASSQKTASLAFLETGLGKHASDAFESKPGAIIVVLESLMGALYSAAKRIKAISKNIQESVANLKKYSKSLTELHRIRKSYTITTTKYTQMVEKGEYWVQEALDASEKTSEIIESTTGITENAVEKSTQSLLNSKETLKMELAVVEQSWASAQRLTKSLKNDSQVQDFLALKEKLLKQIHDSEALIEVGQKTSNNDNVPQQVFAELSDRAKIKASLSINEKSTMTLFTIVQDRLKLQAQGLALGRSEADQWTELQMKGGDTRPPPIGAIGKRIVRILSHSLTSELAQILTRKISAHLTSDLTQMMVDKVNNQVPDTTAHDVAAGLSTGLETTISGIVPVLMARLMPLVAGKSLFKGLINVITRGLVHSLAPTLTYTLSASNDEHVYCHHCYYLGKDCNRCSHSSATDQNSMAALNYYTSYYTDYFSEYYVSKEMGHYGAKSGDVEKSPRLP